MKRILAIRYLEFCRRLHEKHEDQIFEDIRANGGYALHFDGSTEQKCGKTSFVLKDSISGHVLISEMIESENHKAVKTLLKMVRDKYGIPSVNGYKVCLIKTDGSIFSSASSTMCR